MPVCPGCERRVSYEQLPVHQHCCEGLCGADGISARDRIEEYLFDLDERFEEGLKENEKEIERRLLRIENELRAK